MRGGEEHTKHKGRETKVEDCGELLEGQGVLAALEDVHAERYDEEHRVQTSANDVYNAHFPHGLLRAGQTL